jgi:DNA-binding response OmpR family regulator
MLETSIKAQGVREYIRKPFEVASLKSIVRRMLTQYPRKAMPSAQVAKGEVRLDTKFRTVWISDKMVATLSPMKAQLLRVLLEAKGPVKREKLLQAVWGEDAKASALEKTVQRLREDLGPTGAQRLQTTTDGYELVG